MFQYAVRVAVQTFIFVGLQQAPGNFMVGVTRTASVVLGCVFAILWSTVFFPSKAGDRVTRQLRDSYEAMASITKSIIDHVIDDDLSPSDKVELQSRVRDVQALLADTGLIVPHLPIEPQFLPGPRCDPETCKQLLEAADGVVCELRCLVSGLAPEDVITAHQTYISNLSSKLSTLSVHLHDTLSAIGVAITSSHPRLLSAGATAPLITTPFPITDLSKEMDVLVEAFRVHRSEVRAQLQETSAQDLENLLFPSNFVTINMTMFFVTLTALTQRLALLDPWCTPDVGHKITFTELSRTLGVQALDHEDQTSQTSVKA
eukprot:Colp12_sorted_trinity150504_noHs@3492